MRRQPVTTDQAGMRGQEDAALATGLVDKLVVLTGEILDIIPQDAQPPGQPAEHRIGQEPRGLSASGGRPRTTIHGSTLTHSLPICKVRPGSVRALCDRAAIVTRRRFLCT